MKATAFLFSVLLGLSSAVSAADEGSFWSRLDADLYGYFKLDACYDTSPVVDGDYAKWVVAGRHGEGDFSSTMNQTRLGLDVRGRSAERIRASGRVEIDFYGGKEDPDPRIRHAWIEVSWVKAGLDLLVGQTSDVISPLFPSTLNYTVAWWAGNIGFRRPQIRLTKRLETKGSARFQLEGALTHNIYDTKAGPFHGKDTGLLTFQARASVMVPVFDSRTMTVGVSGHRGEEDFEFTAGEAERIDSWSVDLDLCLPVSERITLKSELFSGASLAPYLGGIGQGVDPGTLAGVRSRGGWIAADVLPPGGKLRYALGFSLDDVEDADLDPGVRSANRSIFANAVWAATKRIEAGVELSHWRTEYKGQDGADAFRVQTSFIFKL